MVAGRPSPGGTGTVHSSQWGRGLECEEVREQVTGQGYSALRNGSYGCGQSLPVSHWWEGGQQPWLVYVPVLEFVHLLDMYVWFIESLITVPYRCLQCILVARKWFTHYLRICP